MTTARKPVVVAIGDKQETALIYAIGEAERRGTALRVVHSTGVPGQGTDVYVTSTMLEEMKSAGRQVLDAAEHFVEEQGCKISVSYVLGTSGVVDDIEHEASQAAELIVGADDVPWPERMMGGAVAAHLAMHAPCPVTVVPERTYPMPVGGGIMVAIDGDTPATGPLQFAFEQASLGDRELHVLHATRAEIVTDDFSRVRADLSEVLAGWSAQFPDVSVLRYFALDTPEDACVRATEQAELLVVGRPHDQLLPLPWRRGLALKVLRHAHCPVAVVPADYADSRQGSLT